MSAPATRKSKIGRLPFSVREQLNERLLDNQGGGEILPWLNELCKLDGAATITPQNLSEWRAGGFSDWLDKRDKVERTKSLADYCRRMADAGGGSMDLPAAIAGGQLMEVLEDFDPGSLKALLADKPETWIDVITSVAKLQKGKSESRKMELAEVSLAQNERRLALDEARYQRETCKLFVKWYADVRAAEIAADKSLAPAVKIEQLRQMMFGAGEAEDAA